MNKINYNNVNNELSKGSAKGQVPFIELNGRQFADSNFIIEHLIQTYNLSIDRNLATRERAEARAFTVLIEESLFRCLAYDRSRNFSWLASEKGLLPHLNGLKKFLFQKVFLKQLQNNIKKNLVCQGYGRHSPEEIEEIAKKDLNSLSNFLNDKRFLFGDKPSTVDAALFGTLVQFTDTPLNNDKLKLFIEQNTPNLIEFVKRMKAEFWPDWSVTCEQLALNQADIKLAPSTIS
jgi:glutathione S-transferase